jgi:hypothetical protein
VYDVRDLNHRNVDHPSFAATLCASLGTEIPEHPAWLDSPAGTEFEDSSVGYLSGGHQTQSRDLIRFAKHIRACVQEAFGVTLVPEPNFMGFSAYPRADGIQIYVN